MSNIDKFLAKAKKAETPAPQYEEIGGVQDCQICFEPVVGNARYFPSEHILTWKCPKGHISQIEIVL